MEESGFRVPTAALSRRSRQDKQSTDHEQSATKDSPIDASIATASAISPDCLSAGGERSVTGKDIEDGGRSSHHSSEREAAPVDTKKIKNSSEDQDGTFEDHAHPVSAPPLPYTVPHWSGKPCGQAFSLSVIKNGTIIQEIDISHKSYIVFGRIDSCDVILEHPSASRYHAVLQYLPPRRRGNGESDEEPSPPTHSLLASIPTEAGHYIYDLGSTHGTFLNKTKISPRCYCRVRVGQMLKFGGSSRLFLLESGGVEGQEAVELGAEEERKEIILQKEEYERRLAEAKAERERVTAEKEAMGVTWGIMMDDVPGDVPASEEYEIDEEKEAYYKDDPKKALKKFFDREGLELEYEVEEEGPPKARVYTVRVRLPIDTISGEAVAEASLKGRKKDAVILCALNACRMLDAHDILRQSAKAHKRKKRNWEENDYYDSDEDTFLDRTGSIEAKRKKRMKKAGVLAEETESFDTLQAKLSDTVVDINRLEQRLRKDSQSESGGDEVDPLDAYMKSVGDHMDTTRRSEIKHQLHDLRKEEERIRKLISVAMPTALPSVERVVDQRSVPPVGNEKRLASKTKSMLGEQKNSPPISRSPIERKKEAEETPPTKPARSRKSAPKKNKQLIGPMLPPTQSTDALTEGKMAPTDPDYCDWLPPDCQSGDGRTHLNDKFGY